MFGELVVHFHRKKNKKKKNKKQTYSLPSQSNILEIPRIKFRCIKDVSNLHYQVLQRQTNI